MNNLYCVRADFGKYTQHFLQGDYVAIGWLDSTDLSNIQSREEIYPLYRNAHPNDTSNLVIGQQVGQISRFLFEIRENDFVITPSDNTEYIYFGVVDREPNYFFESKDGCPFPHRKRVKWNKKPLQRSLFSVPFQNTIRSSLTVFAINHKKNFFEVINRKDLVPEKELKIEFDYYTLALNQILELDDKEFEILITHILTALGFEGSEHQGRVGDGGVDATGELNVENLAKVKIFVQAKRYKLGTKISANTVKALRQSIPFGGQGAFITTCDYRNDAKEVALEAGFPRIGLINGEQLVDILVKYWSQIPPEFQDKLGLKLGLVIA